MATIEGMWEFKALLNRVNLEFQQIVIDAIDKGADEIVAAARLTAPISELEMHPGQLKDSIHKQSSGHRFQQIVVVDARDARGHFFAAHVEFGHKSPSGTHVPAHPFFYPTWRLMRKRIMGRINRAIAAAAKAQAADGVSTNVS